MKKNTSPTHTRQQVAKMSGVGTGTVARYDFVEDEDYKLTVSKTGKRSNVIQKGYSLTLDMAKELKQI